MRASDRAVSLHADDVLGGQRALVDARRRDPDVAVGVLDRDVAARRSGHSAAVDSADDHIDLLGRVHQLRVELIHGFILEIKKVGMALSLAAHVL